MNRNWKKVKGNTLYYTAWFLYGLSRCLLVMHYIWTGDQKESNRNSGQANKTMNQEFELCFKKSHAWSPRAAHLLMPQIKPVCLQRRQRFVMLHNISYRLNVTLYYHVYIYLWEHTCNYGCPAKEMFFIIKPLEPATQTSALNCMTPQGMGIIKFRGDDGLQLSVCCWKYIISSQHQVKHQYWSVLQIKP